jgi:hypothetical protein
MVSAGTIVCEREPADVLGEMVLAIGWSTITTPLPDEELECVESVPFVTGSKIVSEGMSVTTIVDVELLSLAMTGFVEFAPPVRGIALSA